MKLFLDTNVLLDVLAVREPWAADASALLSLVDGETVKAFVAAHTVSTLDYMLAKAIGRRRANAALVDLVKLVRVAEVNHEIVLQALALGWKDFEDALQAVCAINVEADILVTRDPRDFLGLPIAIASPGEVCSQLSGS